MPDQETNKPDKGAENKQLTNKKILAFALEFGLMIALPLVLFAGIGKWLSNQHHNPAFLYGGIILALITSVVWFFKKIKEIYDDFIN